MRDRKIFLAFSVLLFVAFVFFSYHVAKGRFIRIDFDTTVKFQDHISRRWDLPFSVLSVIGSLEITTIIWVVLTIFLFFKKYWLTATSMVLLPIALGMELFGKLFVFHPSPPYLFYRGVIKFDFFPSSFIHTNYSYPSGHLTRTAFLITFIIVYLFFKFRLRFSFLVQGFLMVFLVAMAISRIYLGEHWLSDVIGGCLIGGSFGILPALLLPKTFKKELN